MEFLIIAFLFLDMIYMIKCIYGGIKISTILRFFINKKETTHCPQCCILTRSKKGTSRKLLTLKCSVNTLKHREQKKRTVVQDMSSLNFLFWERVYFWRPSVIAAMYTDELDPLPNIHSYKPPMQHHFHHLQSASYILFLRKPTRPARAGKYG
jgi:hypothetical protein